MEQRIQALEVCATFEATQSKVQAVENEMLSKLLKIKEAILQEEKQGGGAATSSKELQALRKENEELKQKNAKLEYRVKHMLATMEQLFAEKK